MQHYTDIRKQDWDKRLASKRSPLAVLVDYIHEAVKIIINGEDSCMAVKSAFEVATNDERVKQILVADDQRSYQFLYDLIKNAMDKGEIRDDEDPALLADYFNSTWTGCCWLCATNVTVNKEIHNSIFLNFIFSKKCRFISFFLK